MRTAELLQVANVSIVFYLGTMIVAVLLTAIVTALLVSQRRAR